ncbi:GNAT family N-acetyltransferase [Plantactinospora sonchi]|uniref:GNAT family N-acetyltransferase n=1 Tax=Plantactinospora sonchi TaxID=1544735 RepID=A0ABU7S364_9ACTN
MRTRLVEEDELELLRDIERAAGACFREIGMPEVADDEPLPVAVLAEYRRDGRIRVAVDGTDRPIAYLVSAEVDGNVHIEQVSVHPGHARRGIGRRLLDEEADRAVTHGVPAMTLTTFAEVPWNAPYYARCGFRVLAEPEWGPGLRAIRALEEAHGLDRWPRLCMSRDLR